jgi:hypothetical protein
VETLAAALMSRFFLAVALHQLVKDKRELGALHALRGQKERLSKQQPFDKLDMDKHKDKQKDADNSAYSAPPQTAGEWTPDVGLHQLHEF